MAARRDARPDGQDDDIGGDSLRDRRIPPAVVKRLSLYSRVLQFLERHKVEKISSTDLARELGLNSAQVRKDLAYFGQFGVPGFGYHVSDLRRNLKRILGTDREIPVALVGVGNLGTALLSYGGFARQGFRMACAFDETVRDRIVGPDKVPVHDIRDLESVLARERIQLVVLTVPVEAAQGLADRLVAAGITAILNFVPMRLHTPEHVKVHYVDLAIELESLSFYLR